MPVRLHEKLRGGKICICLVHVKVSILRGTVLYLVIVRLIQIRSTGDNGMQLEDETPYIPRLEV